MSMVVSKRILGPGSQIMGPGSWFQGFWSWVPGPDPGSSFQAMPYLIAKTFCLKHISTKWKCKYKHFHLIIIVELVSLHLPRGTGKVGPETWHLGPRTLTRDLEPVTLHLGPFTQDAGPGTREPQAGPGTWALHGIWDLGPSTLEPSPGTRDPICGTLFKEQMCGLK